MAKKEQRVSLNPETFSEGGGLIDDVDVTFSNCQFEMKDLAGGTNLNPYLSIDLESDDGTVTQYWSCGGKDKFVTSNDGKALVAVGTATTVNKGSNLGILLTSLVNAGFPPDKIGEDIDIMDGMKCHVIRVPEPKRPGLKRNKRADGKEYDRTILTVSKIHTLPWEKSKGSAKGKGKSAEVDGELTMKIEEFVMDQLSQNPDGVPKKMLPQAAFKAFSGDERKEVMQVVFDDGFLGSKDRPWKYEDGVVSM